MLYYNYLNCNMFLNKFSNHGGKHHNLVNAKRRIVLILKVLYLISQLARVKIYFLPPLVQNVYCFLLLVSYFLLLYTNLFSRVEKLTRICITWIFLNFTTAGKLENREIESPRNGIERIKREKSIRENKMVYSNCIFSRLVLKS